MRLSDTLKQPLDKDLIGTINYPYTISYCIRKMQQIQSFNELPRDKRPPEKYWFDEEALQEWFDNIENNVPNSLEIDISDIEN